MADSPSTLTAFLNILEGFTDRTHNDYPDYFKLNFGEIRNMKVDVERMIQMQLAIDKIEETLGADCSEFYEKPNQDQDRMEQYGIRLHEILNFGGNQNWKTLKAFVEEVCGFNVDNFFNYLRSVSAVCSNLIDVRLDFGVFLLLLFRAFSDFFHNTEEQYRRYYNVIWDYHGRRPIPLELNTFFKTEYEMRTMPDCENLRNLVDIRTLALIVLLEDIHSPKTKEYIISRLKSDFAMKNHFGLVELWELDLALNQSYKTGAGSKYRVSVNNLAEYREKLVEGYDHSLLRLKINKAGNRAEMKTCIEATFDKGFQRLVKWEMGMRILTNMFPKRVPVGSQFSATIVSNYHNTGRESASDNQVNVSSFNYCQTTQHGSQVDNEEDMSTMHAPVVDSANIRTKSSYELWEEEHAPVLENMSLTFRLKQNVQHPWHENQHSDHRDRNYNQTIEIDQVQVDNGHGHDSPINQLYPWNNAHAPAAHEDIVDEVNQYPHTPINLFQTNLPNASPLPNLHFPAEEEHIDWNNGQTENLNNAKIKHNQLAHTEWNKENSQIQNQTPYHHDHTFDQMANPQVQYPQEGSMNGEPSVPLSFSPFESHGASHLNDSFDEGRMQDLHYMETHNQGVDPGVRYPPPRPMNGEPDNGQFYDAPTIQLQPWNIAHAPSDHDGMPSLGNRHQQSAIHHFNQNQATAELPHNFRLPAPDEHLNRFDFHQYPVDKLQGSTE